MTAKGRLYICGTPIGNLEDISFRVLKVLKEVDQIAAEDTRRAAQLLRHYQIETPLISYHEHNEKKRTTQLLKSLQEGRDIALVSDAGMPGISDPGREIIKAAIGEEFEVIPIPGPTALISALVVSGLSTERFVFEGFLPRKGRERKERLKDIESEERTIIIYESPYRVKNTLEDLQGFLGSRKIALVREISKLYEEKFYGSIEEVLNKIADREIKGEIVLVIEGRKIDELEQEGWEELTVLEHVELLLKNGYTKKKAIKKVAEIRGLKKRVVYQEAIKIDAGKDY